MKYRMTVYIEFERLELAMNVEYDLKRRAQEQEMSLKIVSMEVSE